MEDKQDHNRNNHNHNHSALILTTAKEESPRKTVIGGGGGGGGDRLKRDEWSEGAVSTLLEAYEAKWILRNRAKLKGHDWEDVARHVSSRANSSKSPKTQTQCKNKIESMKKRYRSESTTGDAASSWPLYSRLDLLLRGTGPPPSSVAPPPPPPPAAAVPSGLILSESPLTVSSQPPHQPLPPSQPLAAAAVAPQPLAINAQNSHGSDGVDRLPKEDMLGTNKSSEQVSNKNNNDNAMVETDSSTPALYSHSKDPPTNKRKMKTMKTMKKKRMRSREENSSNNHDNNNKNSRNGNMEIAESIRWLAEVVVRSEQARMETMKEIERMRAEAEAKRGEMDLKRTEIIANTQLEIARIFASVNNKGVDSSLRIGRS